MASRRRNQGLSVPDFDLLVVFEAIAHLGHSFATMDVADRVRKDHPDAPISARSNSEIGKYLSANRRLLLIDDAGGSGARGHRWQRTVAGDVAAVALWIIERYGIEFWRRYGPRIISWVQEHGAQAFHEGVDRAGRASTAAREWVQGLAELRPRIRRGGRRGAVGGSDETDAAVGWDDARLQVESDNSARRQYRALQSWYRQHRLGAPPGVDGHGQLVGSLIDADAVDANPGLNFLSAEIAAYVEQRVPEIEAAGGTVDRDRLYRNMLSSQPLCFNVFGALRSHPQSAAEVLGDVFGVDIAVVDRIDVEFAPAPRDAYLGDRTAFDAFVAYRTSTGDRAFLGVETKYTEPFSPRVYTAEKHPRYAALTSEAHGFRPGALNELLHPDVNQLWRNTLLALAMTERDGYSAGYVAVLARRDDPQAERAVSRLSRQLDRPDAVLRQATLEALVDRASAEPALAAWASAFRTRYLDLSPVEG